METPQTALRNILLLRLGRICLPPARPVLQPEEVVQAFEIELAALGYVFSSQLAGRLRTLEDGELRDCREWLLDTIAVHLGSDRYHDPLFKNFPHRVPPDTFDLWLDRVLVHFLQRPKQPCLFCHQVGTTHVLSPCLHVICDRCFDASLFTACPVCGGKTEESQFYLQIPPEAPATPRKQGASAAPKLKLLHLAEDPLEAATELFERLCRRPQALAPADREALVVLVEELGDGVFAAVPEKIPVRENVALVFGGLLKRFPPERVLATARPFIKTATDVLRLIAAYSDADVSLQRTFKVMPVQREVPLSPTRWFGRFAKFLQQPHSVHVDVSVHIGQYRFKVARLPRPLRRALLGMLESFAAEYLYEDLQRHRSYWVWVGEFLHPHEYADRFPKVADGFAMLRKKDPRGQKTERYPSFAARLEDALAANDSRRVLDLLASRPGELGRRFDHALRRLDENGRFQLLEQFASAAGRLSAPVLLTLLRHLPLREKPVPRRIFWPKGGQSRGVSAEDRRAPLPLHTIAAALAVVEAELLLRYAERPALADLVLDRDLAQVVAPFNERTASPAAVALPRGSRVHLPDGKMLRLFLHWCQPAAGQRTDIDLSIVFFGDEWDYRGVCSYYALALELPGVGKVAQSSGDFTSAPFPDGASEFVDLDLEKARTAGFRWAVMVVNAFSGLPFSELERAYAGLMVRDSAAGLRFDPQTVELKFQITGHNGIFLPMAVDLESRTLHWLDTFSKGGLAFNNVANSKSAIARICPEMIDYFARGSRASLYDLGILHAAARAQRVFLREENGEIQRIDRRPGESPGDFLRRLWAEAGSPAEPVELRVPLLALLYRGDLELPDGAEAYALFRETTKAALAPGDLI